MRLTSKQAEVMRAVLDGAGSVADVERRVDWNPTSIRSALMTIAWKLGVSCEKVRDTFAVIVSRAGDFDVDLWSTDEELREPSGIAWPDYGKHDARLRPVC